MERGGKFFTKKSFNIKRKYVLDLNIFSKLIHFAQVTNDNALTYIQRCMK
jgi:hypothetical protein